MKRYTVLVTYVCVLIQSTAYVCLYADYRVSI